MPWAAFRCTLPEPQTLYYSNVLFLYSWVSCFSRIKPTWGYFCNFNCSDPLICMSPGSTLISDDLVWWSVITQKENEAEWISVCWHRTSVQCLHLLGFLPTFQITWEHFTPGCCMKVKTANWLEEQSFRVAKYHRYDEEIEMSQIWRIYRNVTDMTNRSVLSYWQVGGKK